MSLSAKGFGWHQRTTAQKNRTTAGGHRACVRISDKNAQAPGSVTAREEEGGRGGRGKKSDLFG